jgi:hypothetical protein
VLLVKTADLDRWMMRAGSDGWPWAASNGDIVSLVAPIAGCDAEGDVSAGGRVEQNDIAKDDRIVLDGELVTVVAVTATPDGFEGIVKSPTRGLIEAYLRRSQLDDVRVASHDGGGDAGRALTAVWARWMAWSVPRIRSAVLATRPLRPYAHQDDAVFGVMLSQPRLRFLLADEPGTGKTLMTGMYWPRAVAGS